jgi:hypothetical protein
MMLIMKHQKWKDRKMFLFVFSLDNEKHKIYASDGLIISCFNSIGSMSEELHAILKRK